MAKKEIGIGLFGVGQIGGNVFRQMAEHKELNRIRAAMDIKDPNTIANLIEHSTVYGSIYGNIGGIVFYDDVTKDLEIASLGYYPRVRFVNPLNEPDYSWDDLGVDIVIDATGRATKREIAQGHIDRGARYVIVTAPSKERSDCDAALLFGINHEDFNPEKDHIISMASCTTGCFAPIIKTLRKVYRFMGGFFTTTHSYTSTQVLVDSPASDESDSWAAAENILISESGATKALRWIFPDLPEIKGKADRVPVPSGSLLNCYLMVENRENPMNLPTVDGLKKLFQDVSVTELKTIMSVTEKKWPSSRFLRNSHSAIVRTDLIQVSGNLIQVVAWYDNVWGYTARLYDLVNYISSRI